MKLGKNVKLIIILIAIAIIGLIIWINYFNIQDNSIKSLGDSVNTQNSTINSNTPSYIINNPNYIIANTIKYPFIKSDNSTLLALNDAKNSLWRYDLNSFTGSKVTDFATQAINKVIYAPNGNKMIIISADQEISNNLSYDIDNNKSSILNKGITDAFWSNKDNDKIYYIFYDESEENNKYQFNYSNPQGGYWKTIFTINNEEGSYYKSYISNSEKNLILITVKSDSEDAERSNIYIINLENGNKTKILENVIIDLVAWSPDDKNIVYRNSADNSIYKYNIDNNSIEQLNLYLLDNSIIDYASNNFILYSGPANNGESLMDIHNIYYYNFNSDYLVKINSDFKDVIINPDYLKYQNGKLYFTSSNQLYSTDLDINKLDQNAPAPGQVIE